MIDTFDDAVMALKDDGGVELDAHQLQLAMYFWNSAVAALEAEVDRLRSNLAMMQEEA